MHLKETECIDTELEEFKKNTLNSVITAAKKEYAKCKVNIYIITHEKKKTLIPTFDKLKIHSNSLAQQNAQEKDHTIRLQFIKDCCVLFSSWSFI